MHKETHSYSDSQKIDKLCEINQDTWIKKDKKHIEAETRIKDNNEGLRELSCLRVQNWKSVYTSITLTRIRIVIKVMHKKAHSYPDSGEIDKLFENNQDIWEKG